MNFETVYNRVEDDFKTNKEFWSSLPDDEVEIEVVMLVDRICEEENVDTSEYWAWMTSVPNDKRL